MSSKSLTKIIYLYPELKLEDKLFLLELISLDFISKKNLDHKKSFIRILKSKIEMDKLEKRINKLYNI